MSLLDFNGPPCSKCGIRGIHACPGKPLPPATEDEQERLRKIFENLAENHMVTTDDHDRLG